MQTANARWAFTAIACLAAIVAAWQIGWLKFSSERFDSARWIAAKNDDRDSPRMAMVADLQENYLTVGLGKKDVAKILGKPEEVHEPDYFGKDAQLQKATKIWSYAIGAWSGFRMDTDHFAVAFDKDGKVLTTWTWQS